MSEKTVTIPLSCFDKLRSENELIKSENEELKKGKRVLINRHYAIKAGVFYVNNALHPHDRRKFSFLTSESDSIEDVDFDYIAKDSHDEVVSKLKEVISNRSIDSKKEFEVLDAARGADLAVLKSRFNALLKVQIFLSVSLLLSFIPHIMTYIQ